MPFEIENEPVTLDDYKHDRELRDFVTALSELEVGQSFVIQHNNMPANLTTSMRAIGHLLDRRFKSRKLGDGQGIRIGRVDINHA